MIMKQFRKIYLEISNICNLRCSFCPGTKREAKRMQPDEFRQLMPKLQPYTDYLYFHLMGEPLCHPHLKEFLQIAGEYGFKVILTTNGTLLYKQQDVLLTAPALHKVNISLHAFEANDLPVSFARYLQDCCEFGRSAEGRILVSYRLWNNGGLDDLNNSILETLHRYFQGEWKQERHGVRIGDRIYLEHGDKFEWPDLNAPESSNNVFCYGLRDQLGILCDATVVPCCLDHEGDIELGNLLTQDLSEILASPRAKALYAGFSNRKPSEELCRRCGYARRFQK